MDTVQPFHSVPLDAPRSQLTARWNPGLQLRGQSLLLTCLRDVYYDRFPGCYQI